MDYNDFPILSNQEYELINSHFSIEKFERNYFLKNLLNELNSLKNSKIESNLNKKLKVSIDKSNQILIKLFDNLASMFNIQIQSSSIQEINLFAFLEKLINLATLFSIWKQNETKTYYQSISHKSEIEILNSVKQILNDLKNSSVITFKHM
jgi:hypothetical protein